MSTFFMDNLAAITAPVNGVTGHAFGGSAAEPDRTLICAFLAAFVGITIYLHRNRTAAMRWLLGLSIATLAMCTFLQGAWPAACALCVWSVMAFRRCAKDVRLAKHEGPKRMIRRPYRVGYEEDTRIGRLFGQLIDDGN